MKEPTVKIEWRVDDGPVHEIPEGATVTFTLLTGVKRVVRFDQNGLFTECVK